MSNKKGYYIAILPKELGHKKTIIYWNGLNFMALGTNAPIFKENFTAIQTKPIDLSENCECTTFLSPDRWLESINREVTDETG